MNKDKILFLCFSHQLDNFLKYHIEKFEKEGFCVQIVCLDEVGAGIQMSRRGWVDIPIVIWRISSFLRKHKPDLVITIAPKVGFVTSLASLFSFWMDVKYIHWFTGQVWSNDTGLTRFIKKSLDKVTYYMTDCILCDSISQKKYLGLNGFGEDKITVLGMGSICGVNDNLFKIKIKKSNLHTVKVGVIGRICRDKGALWLLEFVKTMPLSDKFEFHLYGELDLNQRDLFLFEKMLDDKSCYIRYHARQNSQKAIYSKLDIVLNPSFREGFSNVLAEAQVSGLPVVARKIYGVESTMIEGETGFLFDSSDDLTRYLHSLMLDDKLRLSFSESGRRFACKNFKRKEVVQKIFDFYVASV